MNRVLSYALENKVPLLVIAGGTLIMGGAAAYLWSNATGAIDKYDLAKTVYNCYCNAVASNSCQDGLNKLVGLGMSVANATLACGPEGTLQQAKSAATTTAVWDVLLATVQNVAALGFVVMQGRQIKQHYSEWRGAGFQQIP